MKRTKNTPSIFIYGRDGRMGDEIARLLKASTEWTLLEAADSLKPTLEEINLAEIVLDFSSPDGNSKLFELAKKMNRKFFLIGTTGLKKNQLDSWRKLAPKNSHYVLSAPNTSVGIRAFAKILMTISKNLSDQNFEVEITETHHSKKIDAPSGTALFLANTILKQCPKLHLTLQHPGLRKKNSVGIHSVRGGGVFGEHSVRFIGAFEEISVSHRAFSRTLFAQGALSLASDLIKWRKPGFKTLEELT